MLVRPRSRRRPGQTGGWMLNKQVTSIPQVTLGATEQGNQLGGPQLAIYCVPRGGRTMKAFRAFLVVMWLAGLMSGMQESADSAVQTKIIALEKAWNQAYKM